MSWAFLAVSLVGLVLVANTYFSKREGTGSIVSSFAGWFVGDLPLHHLAWQVVATVGFGFGGAFDSWPGFLGLGVAVIDWAGLIGLAVVQSRSGAVVEEALTSAGVPLRPDRSFGRPVARIDTMWRGWRLVLPIPLRGRQVEVVRDLDYVGDGINRHRLDIVRSRHALPTGAPVLLYIHGGAWVGGNKAQQGLPMLYELARRGWVCVTVNYRLSPSSLWPAQIVDCKRALAWVRDHIEDFGGDSRFIAVGGGSAGGHLSALLALTPGDPNFQPGFEEADTSVDACVPFYGVYDLSGGGEAKRYVRGLIHLLEWFVFKRRLADDRAAFEAASPILRITEEAPPFFVLHGTTDSQVPVTEARRFVVALRERSGATVAYAELPRAQHVFDVLPSVRSGNAVAGVVRFLEAVRYCRLLARVDEEAPRPAPPRYPVRQCG